MLGVFLNVVFPVCLLAAAGGALQRFKRLTIAPINQLAVYVLTPALLFNGLMQSTLTAAEGVQIGLFVVLQVAIMIGAGALAARLGRLDQPTTSAFVLGVTFSNAGNYGLPLTSLAFGEAGLERGMIYYVTQAMLTGTLAVFIASRGHADTRQSLLNVLRTPIIYATVAGLAFRVAGVPVPPILSVPIAMAANAALPVMLVLLGAQLAMLRSIEDRGPLAMLTVIRLLLAPAMALLTAGLFGLPAATRNVLVLQSAMPTAVATTIYAAEFGARPALLTAAVFITTLLSLLTLTLLLALLGVQT